MWWNRKEQWQHTHWSCQALMCGGGINSYIEIFTTSLHNITFYHHMYTCCDKLSQHLYIASSFFKTFLHNVILFHHMHTCYDKLSTTSLQNVIFFTKSLHKVYLITTCLVPVINYHHISTYSNKLSHLYITSSFFTTCKLVVINPPMQISEWCGDDISQYVDMLW